jgi:hypothetical protein
MGILVSREHYAVSMQVVDQKPLTVEREQRVVCSIQPNDVLHDNLGAGD